MKKVIVIAIFIIPFVANGQNKIITIAKNYIENKRKKTYSEVLFVSVSEQKMYHIEKDKILNSYIISSSSYGVGNKVGSNKTPLGLHKVKDKFGNETPLNGRMVGRVFYGQIAQVYSDTTRSKTDDITSRILWLDGLEDELNKGEGIDSYKRFIYIHGTSEEGRLGTPASHGCIRMKNKAVIELYDKINIGTLVLIL
jgi:lipoprotein-anchoring transpeptidase ErfK/SrfK